MGRRRTAAVQLPSGVEVKHVKGHSYYYWNPGRGTEREGERIPLPNADTNPEAFWREVKRRQGEVPPTFPTGSVADLVTRYRASYEYQKLSESSKSAYDVTLNRFIRPDGWGLLRARDLTPAACLAGRDSLTETPGMANQMLAVGRTVWNWGIPLALVNNNPFDKIPDLDIPDRGHVPWPAWAIEHALAHVPEDLRRLIVLGRMTCQRESDLVRLGPIHRERTGIWCRPVKTRRRRRSFFIPLSVTDALELDRWAATPIMFENPRWHAPIARHREDLYLYSPRGAAYNPSSLRARWTRWLTRTAAGRQLCSRWREWLAGQVARYEWEIDPEDSRGPTIHGLRGTGILLRRAEGYAPDQIANDIGMSPQMVEHYMRFRDQMDVAAAGRLRLVETGGQ